MMTTNILALIVLVAFAIPWAIWLWTSPNHRTIKRQIKQEVAKNRADLTK